MSIYPDNLCKQVIQLIIDTEKTGWQSFCQKAKHTHQELYRFWEREGYSEQNILHLEETFTKIFPPNNSFVANAKIGRRENIQPIENKLDTLLCYLIEKEMLSRLQNSSCSCIKSQKLIIQRYSESLKTVREFSYLLLIAC